MITLSHVNKTFQTKDGLVRAVDDVSFTVREGEIFGIIGYSGAGKSTLLRLLNMLEKPTSGTVTIDAQEISSLDGAALRQARQDIGMVFQHFNLLWSRTVRENIAFPLEIAGVPKAEREARVTELLSLVGLEGRGSSYPSQLSGGQKQRVGIARALANNPKVLLGDEATSALDPKTTDAILDLLVEINQKLGITVVLITHEMHVIRKICHRVAVMEAGKVVELDDVLKVFHHPKAPITQEFIKQVTEPEETQKELEHVIAEAPDRTLLQLTFVGDTANSPIITSLIRRYEVDVNIVQGKVSQTQTGAYGTLFLQLQGEPKMVDDAIAFLKEEQVTVEVMHRA